MDLLRIAVCEDDPAEKDALISGLARCSIPSSCRIYDSGEAFLKAYYPGCADLILMDIYMDGISGVETVARIRAADPQVRIAFLTTSPDFTMDGYRLRVDRYLLKPFRQEDLEEVLRLADQSRKNQPAVSLFVQGKEQKVPQASVSYAEQAGHTLYLHLADGETMKANMKISGLAEQLSSPPFYQFHKSFLVNIAHVRYFDAELKAFMMNGGGCAYIRRDSLREAQAVYSRFMFDQIRKQEE